MPRTGVVDRVLHTHERGPWIATAVILIVGAVIFLWVVSPTEWKRRTMMRRLAIGDDSTAVVRVLGPPVRCAPATIERVREGIPVDWPPPVAESAIAWVGEATRERWIYAIDLRERPPCDEEDGHTEIGIGADGRVLWYIAVTGKTPIRLPDEYTPSGSDS